MIIFKYFLILFTLTIDLNIVNSSEEEWWTHTVIYEVFVRSFRDSNGDGIGDLKGITNNLNLFVDAGVEVLYLSSIYESPMVDEGYDVKNFTIIDPDYGNMEDLEELIEKAKEMDIKIMLDFVPNHVSIESSYFKNSVKRVEGYEDFILWADGKIDPDTNETMPPSNWISYFSGSAWEWNEERGQYYLHHYTIEQADVNFRNPNVFDEMTNLMIFYLDKGVYGFRIDSTAFLIEAINSDGTYPDDPKSGIDGTGPNGFGDIYPIYSQEQNESFHIIYKWREIFDEYSKNTDGISRVLMPEYYGNLSFTLKLFGNETHKGSQIPFNFDILMELNNESNAKDIVFTINRWLTNVRDGCTPNWVLGNRDFPRLSKRFGGIKMDGLTLLVMLLPGIAITYQGDELGMTNVNISAEDTHDPLLRVGIEFSRDPQRTPYQWDDSKNAGFSNASKTWLPIADDYEMINLKKEKEDDKSHYKVYREAAKARNKTVLKHGDYDIEPINDHVFVLTRCLENHWTIGMVMNTCDDNLTVNITEMRGLGDELIVIVTSINSEKMKNDTINPGEVFLLGEESFMFKSKPKDFEKPNEQKSNDKNPMNLMNVMNNITRVKRMDDMNQTNDTDQENEMDQKNEKKKKHMKKKDKNMHS